MTMIRTPTDAALPITALVDPWESARIRTFTAEHTPHAQPDPEDYWTELAAGARIATEATSSRWCAIAGLLRAHAVESWAQVGNAIRLTETEARDGFVAWVWVQRALHAETSTIGLTEAAADELYGLAEGVQW